MHYSYAQVENALAELYGIPPDGRGAFLGRIKHLQRCGLVFASPGKGRRIEYTFSNAFTWACALEAERLGIDPKIAVDLGRVMGAYEGIAASDRNVLLRLLPTSFGRDWSVDVLPDLPGAIYRCAIVPAGWLHLELCKLLSNEMVDLRQSA